MEHRGAAQAAEDEFNDCNFNSADWDYTFALGKRMWYHTKIYIELDWTLDSMISCLFNTRTSRGDYPK